MGYYTDFELRVDHVNPLLQTSLEKEIEKMNVFEGGDVECGWYANAKWYNYNEDMLLLSSRFPNVVFTLHGIGESADDLWVAYYMDGAYQFSKADIIYDDFDMNKLDYKEQLDLSMSKKYSYQST